MTADHGEGLGNHDWAYHGKHIFNEQLRVPLIVRFPDRRRAGKVDESIVELTDLAPTLFEMAEGSAYKGSEPMMGQSLLPRLSGTNAAPSKRWAFAQRETHLARNVEQMKAWERAYWEAGDTYAIQDESFKYIFRTEGADQFFDLRQDPYETSNRIAEHADLKEKYRKRLLETLNVLQRTAGPAAKTMDPSALERLKDLGYIQ